MKKSINWEFILRALLLKSLVLISFNNFAQVDAEKLFDSISIYQVKEKRKDRIKRLRFNYEQDIIEAKKYTAVIKKGAIVMALKDQKKYRIPTPIIVKAQEERSGSHFSIIFNKAGEPIYVCESRDLTDVTKITEVTPNKVQTFKKERIKFNYLDEKRGFSGNILFELSSHDLKPFIESGGSAYSVSGEFKFNQETKYPMYLTTTITSLRSNSLNWDSISAGFSIGYRFNEAKTSSWQTRISAQTAFFGVAQFDDQSDSLRGLRYDLSLLYEYQKFLFEAGLGFEKFIFSKDSSLENLNNDKANSFSHVLSFKIGRSFDL